MSQRATLARLATIRPRANAVGNAGGGGATRGRFSLLVRLLLALWAMSCTLAKSSSRAVRMR